MTALHEATSEGRVEIVALFLNNGCDVNVANKVSYK